MTFSALDSGLLGPLVATDAMRAVFSDEARLAAMIEVETALAKAQAELGLAPEELAEALAALKPSDFDLVVLGEKTAIAGVPTIPFVKAVQARLPKELEPHFHFGATTQDILDTALVLQMRQGFALVAQELRAILEGLAALAETNRETPCVGRSYGQHAAPVTFGFKVAVWASGIAEPAETLASVRDQALAASLGGPVGTLAAMGVQGPHVLERFAATLDLRADAIAWHARRARMVGAGAWLATLIGALAKMAGDIAHLCSTEVGEVSEPHIAGRGGSSAMPHKRNPVSCTVILAAQTAARGHVVTLLDAMAAQHERPAGLWHGEWHALPQLFGLASGALHEAKSLARGLVVDQARMRANIDLTKGLLFADAAAGALADDRGRGAAHTLVERAADRVRQEGSHLRDVLALMPETAGADLEAAFDLKPSIEAGALWTDRALTHIRRVGATLA